MAEQDLRVFLLAGAALFAIGLWGVIAAAETLRRVLGINIMSTGVFFVLITTAARTTGEVPDPVPHAMVLTGIVVSVCATALALALAESEQEARGQDGEAPDHSAEPAAGTRPSERPDATAADLPGAPR